MADGWISDEDSGNTSAVVNDPPRYEGGRTFRNSNRGFRGGSGRGGESRGGRGGENRGGGNRTWGSGREAPQGNWRTRNEENASNGEDKSMSVASSMIGKIIGRGGSKIRELESESGCRIKINKEDGASQTTVLLVGSADAKEKAERMIDELLNDGGGSAPRQTTNRWEDNDTNSSNRSQGKWQNESASNGEDKIMMVTTTLIGKIIGSGGSKIRELESESGCRIKINKDFGASETRVALIGSADSQEAAEKLITELLNDSGTSGPRRNQNRDDENRWEDNNTNSSNRSQGKWQNEGASNVEDKIMMVPTSLIGKIIGSGGSKIRELEADSGCRIKINKDDGSSETRVSLIGSSDSQEAAEKLIDELLNDRRNQNRDDENRWENNDTNSSNRSQGKWQNESTSNVEDKIMMVPTSLIGRIIGSGGSKIRELEADSGCRIKINKDDGSSETRVSLIGSSDSQETAEKLIDELLNERRNQNRDDENRWEDNNTNSSNRSQGKWQNESASNVEDKIMMVTTSLIGKIIGSGGSKIRELEADSGCRIKINKDDGSSETRVSLIGSSESQETAEKLIDELLNERRNQNREDENRWENNDTNSSNRSQGKWQNESASNVDDKIMMVPTSLIGKIIGSGGSKIRELEADSGCRIKINKDDGSSETRVSLIGSSDSQETAEKLIDDLLGSSKPKHNKQKDDSEEEDNEDMYIVTEDGTKLINWEKLNAAHDTAQKKKWSKLPPLKKDFYLEDPAVTNMPLHEVERFRKDNHGIVVKRTFEEKEGLRPIPNPVQTFEQAFAGYPEILDEIYKQNFKTPSPIQAQAWPVLLGGEDLIGIAQTGTGKTLAFLLPAFIHIEGQAIPRSERSGPNVLVLAPTRELALQIKEEVAKYSYRGIKAVCIYGGGSRKEQIETVEKGVEIVIATPGRFNDLVMARVIDVQTFTYLVLDEADRMLDLGFEPQIRKSLLDIRPDRQTVMTSATWPSGVRRLAETYMKDPIQVFVGSLDLAAVHTVTQELLFVEGDDKFPTLLEFFEKMAENDKAIVFCGRKATTDYVSSELALLGIDCQSIHGSRDQCDREQALEDIKTGDVRILIATDVASRGIDINDITHVINYDFPRDMEEYVHRVGRTGRAGRTGKAISFISRTDWGNAGKLIEIMEEANQEVPDELREMLQRFEAMKLRRGDDYKPRGRGRGRGGGFGGGGGGFGGGNRW